MDFELFKERAEDVEKLIKSSFFEVNLSSTNELLKRDKEEGNKARISLDGSVGICLDEREASLHEELKIKRMQLSDVQKEKVAVEKETRIFKDELVGLETNLKKILAKKKYAEDKCGQLALEKEISPFDAKILDSLKKKYKTYKNITGIHWDFQAPEKFSRGYITNKGEKTVSSFNVENSSEKAWSAIEEAAHGDWLKDKSSADKENAIPKLLKDIQNIHFE